MNKTDPSINNRFFILFMLLIQIESGFCQVTGGLNFQAVLRNGSGDLKPNATAGIEIFILQGDITGPIIFSELHNVTSNAFGLINLIIGAENMAGFSSIDWALGPYFIKLVIDGMELGTSPLLSVPYALYALNGNGTPGPKGETGLPGPKGEKGDTGPPGSKGNKGNPGDNGPQGSKGDKGDTGPKGPTGDTGLQGPKGDTGPQGLKGNMGDTGPQGLKGNTGDAGVKGSKGEIGDAGPKGSKGDQGDTGPKGIQGDTGDTGPHGPDGYTGPAGPAKCIAFGCINSDGTVLSGTGNFTCTFDTQNTRYKITIGGEDYFYANYTTLVTPATDSNISTYSTDSAEGSLLITLFKNYNFGWQSVFHFAVFKN